MANNLTPLNVDLPARNGLSSEAFGGGLDTSWAQELDNIVFDNFGRLCARKAFRKLTTTPTSGNPSIDSLHEYVKNAASDFIISVDANGDIYSGTDTLTDITGSFTVSDTNMQWVDYEGEVIGVGQAQDPVYWDGSAGSVATLHSKISDWQATTAYAIGDIVKAVSSPSTDEYFVVTADAGTSGGTEPSWNTTEGGTTDDNGITWTTVAYPRGRCILSAYGRLWILDEDRTTIRYSALGVGYDFSSTNGGGSINTNAIFGRPDDAVTSIATFNNNLVIFSRYNIVIYSNIATPSNLQIVDQILNTGCIARDTVQNIGNDLVFLSYQGLRSLGRTIELEKVPLQDLSVNYRNALIDDINARLENLNDDSDFKSVYSPTEGIYVLKAGNSFYCFDFKKSFIDPKGFRPPRISTWSSINFDSITLGRDNTIYMGKGGAIGDYSGYTEWGQTSGQYQDGVPYIMSYRSSWVDFSELAPELQDRTKIVKKMTGDFLGGASYDVDFIVAYDFNDKTYRRTKSLALSEGSQWNVAEWGYQWANEGDYLTVDPITAQLDADEWSGSTEKRFAMVNHEGSGDHVQFGYETTINGGRFCIQNTTIFVKLGRLARGSARAY